MFCSKCGKELDNNAQSCPNCGASVGGQTIVIAAEPTMKWFKFLIYFGLYASAVINAFSGIAMLTGSPYGDAAVLVYAMFENLKVLDIIVGIVMLALAGFALYARSRLAAFCENGPKMLTIMYGLAVACNLIYVIGLHIVLPRAALAQVDLSSCYISIAADVAMIFVNRSYFAKRQDKFVNV